MLKNGHIEIDIEDNSVTISEDNSTGATYECNSIEELKIALGLYLGQYSGEISNK